MRELLCRRGVIPLFTFLTVKEPLRWRFVSAALVFDSSTTGQRKGMSTRSPNDQNKKKGANEKVAVAAIAMVLWKSEHVTSLHSQY